MSMERERSDSYRWRLEFDLPSGTVDDPYEPADLAQQLRELADEVEASLDPPPTGDIWGRDGRLLARSEFIEPTETPDA